MTSKDGLPSGEVRTRFAPSPTGDLHVGGARTALFNWLFARHHKGRFILRIEDTDEVRSTQESVGGILESLRWLSIDWDEGPVDLESDYGPVGPYYQMRRLDIYRKYADKLLAGGQAYPCYCSKEDLDAMRRLAALEKRPPRYDGRCRSLSEARRRELEAQGKTSVLRFKMPEGDRTVVVDAIRGHVSFENKLLQDLVIMKASGIPTYNFACVIDDHLMRISHVIRGDEHLSNTPSQIRIGAALGFTPPVFAHLSMILGPDGAKLSKRHGANSVLDYRSAGFYPPALRNYLALLGWAPGDSQEEIFEGDALSERFHLRGCQKNPAAFDQAKLLWMNGEYLRRLEPAALIEAAQPFLKEAGLLGKPGLNRAVSLERGKYKLLSDVPRLLEFFYSEPAFTEKARSLVSSSAPILLELSQALSGLRDFQAAALEAAIREFCLQKGLKTSQVFHPLRAAVSGRTEGPSLFEMLEILGKGAVLSRLQASPQERSPR